MNRMVRNVAATLALFGLVASQQALAVRSADSLPAPGAKVSIPQGQRVGSPVVAANPLHGTNGFVIGSIAIVSIVALLLAATVGKHDGDNNPDTRSPG